MTEAQSTRRATVTLHRTPECCLAGWGNLGSNYISPNMPSAQIRCLKNITDCFRTTQGIDYNWCRRYIRLCIRWGLHKQNTSLRQLNTFGLHWKQHSILHHETSFNVHRNKEVETTLTYRGNHPLWRCLGNASLIPMLNRNGNDGDKWIGHSTGIRSNHNT